jgi:beta-glucosidase-like glycosyl hydrolase
MKNMFKYIKNINNDANKNTSTYGKTIIGIGLFLLSSSYNFSIAASTLNPTTHNNNVNTNTSINSSGINSSVTITSSINAPSTNNLNIHHTKYTKDDLKQFFIVYPIGKIGELQKYGGFILWKNNFDKDINIACEMKKRNINGMVMVDQEGGAVIRLANANLPPNPYEASHLSDADFKDKSFLAGKDLKKHCIDVNLAPVAEIGGILNRSYSNNMDTVQKYDSLFAQGMNQAGIVATYKHFPGVPRRCYSVNSDDDKVKKLPFKIKPGSEVELCEEARKGELRDKAKLFNPVFPNIVMMGNRIYRDYSPLPAVLDPSYNHWLRQDVNFHGLVISDAIWEIEASPYVIYNAFKNVDMVMVPDIASVDEATDYIIQKLKTGEITDEELDAKKERIKKVREWISSH